MAGLQGAVESAAPVSRLHEHRSADLADFPVPSGREEEWRFTPLRRLRGLQGDAPLAQGKVRVEVDAAPAVSVARPPRGDARFGTAFLPADRVSARAFASFDEGTVISVPPDTDVIVLLMPRPKSPRSPAWLTSFPRHLAPKACAQSCTSQILCPPRRLASSTMA